MARPAFERIELLPQIMHLVLQPPRIAAPLALPQPSGHAADQHADDQRRMTSTNSGKVTEAAGSLPLNGSSDTVTIWRLATAKATMMTASGTRISAATILRSNVTSGRAAAS